ncbi:hypothetical protein GYMLUDRAFT_162867 [Collybiopsis luxurians FD-317 M1]|uniref:ASST-domain-containing protein n=1 Tax=Collybiopsis luxurians FD-317 M1 TaxID=944289 RepID=A0A0D0CKY5_9AGAR|nr:hypothetical protein GYMLUDRAFT_162867 [Collybiopsis luxurians FD-317 M1]
MRLLSILCFAAFAFADSVFIASSNYTAGVFGAGPVQTFFSANYTPSAWNFVKPRNKSTTISPGYLFTAPRGTDTVRPGPLIYDNNGHLVWDGTIFGETLVFQVEIYLGEPHIVTWAGDFLATGVGNGYVSLINNKYELIATFTTDLGGITNPTDADFHEVRITSRNTAVMPAYQTKLMDLSPYGGLPDGYIADSVFQEINITTGKPLFTWSASEHVDPGESYVTPGFGGAYDPWDYFHINSIDPSDDGNYLISSRYCFTLYYINGTNGDIIWRMGGKNSSFAMGDGANFSYQHHARWIFKNDTYAVLTVFDNASQSDESNESSSRGLHLAVNFTSMSVELVQDFIPYNTSLSQSQGSVQLQPDGKFLVGWGFMPWASEYTSSGELLWVAQFGVIGGNNNEAYRTLRFNWTGEPTAPPSVKIIKSSASNSSNVYASWNGDTRTERWELLGSNDSSGSAASSISNTSRSGFETTITVNTSAHKFDFFAVRALGEGNTSLGVSDFSSIQNRGSRLIIGSWKLLLAVISLVAVFQGV